MSYSVDPPQLIGLAERLRRILLDGQDAAVAVQRATDGAALALARTAHPHSAFVDLTEPRVDLAHRIVARGRAAVAAVHTAVLAYLTADDEMAWEWDAARVTNPFDPVVFGRWRL